MVDIRVVDPIALVHVVEENDRVSKRFDRALWSFFQILLINR